MFDAREAERLEARLTVLRFRETELRIQLKRTQRSIEMLQQWREQEARHAHDQG